MQVSFIQKSIVVAFGAVALLGATAGAGQAFNIVESPDTGALPGGAQDAGTIASGANDIKGAIGGAADLFKFTVGPGGGQLVASTAGRGNNPLLDAQLFLFKDNGSDQALGLAGNNGALNAPSVITKILAAGIYYIGISASSLDPRTTGNVSPGNPNFLFAANDSTLLLPTSLLTGWADRPNEINAAGGRYTINMAFTPTVPSPALLPGLAALGFSAIRKRKAKAAVA
jgi:hypothetical protein